MNVIAKLWRIVRCLTVSLLCGYVVGCSSLSRYFFENNFSVVKEGKLYRSGMPGYKNLKSLLVTYGIKTVVVLTHKVPDEVALASAMRGVVIYTIPIPPSHLPKDKDIEKFLAIVKNPQNHPILIHCYHGADRTGVLIAIYRIEEEGWTLHEAEKEMRDHMCYKRKYFRFLEERYKNKNK